MDNEYKIMIREDGETVTYYDPQTEDIVITVTANEYKAFAAIHYAIKEYWKIRKTERGIK